MRYAIRLAQRAEVMGEVPIGAVIVKDNMCMAEGWNAPIATCDPTAHAEIRALREAGSNLENYRITHTTLYVTLEPCLMCYGAICHARVGRLVFGATDPKRGVVCSALGLPEETFLNHQPKCEGGVLSDECSTLLKDFFLARRK